MFGKDKQAARMVLAAHTAVLHKLVSKGLEVLQPLGDHLRYDLEETVNSCVSNAKQGDMRLQWGVCYSRALTEQEDEVKDVVILEMLNTSVCIALNSIQSILFH
jgi:hypothetical protein